MDESYSRLSCGGCGEGCAHKKEPRANARPLRDCKRCGVRFKPKDTTTVTFCSRQCAFAHKAENALGSAKKPAFCTVYFLDCPICSKGFTSRLPRERCSKVCDMEHARRDSLRRNQAAHRQDAKVIQCDECQCLFCPVYGSSNATLCAPCKGDRARAHKAMARSLRKARERAAHVESVNPIKVFERDGWLCRLCGVPTPRSKRGTYEDDAPELDHVVPLAKGGPHTYANTQCACRRCNGLKGDQEGWRPKTPAPHPISGHSSSRTGRFLSFAHPRNG